MTPGKVSAAITGPGMKNIAPYLFAELSRLISRMAPLTSRASPSEAFCPAILSNASAAIAYCREWYAASPFLAMTSVESGKRSAAFEYSARATSKEPRASARCPRSKAIAPDSAAGNRITAIRTTAATKTEAPWIHRGNGLAAMAVRHDAHRRTAKPGWGGRPQDPHVPAGAAASAVVARVVSIRVACLPGDQLRAPSVRTYRWRACGRSNGRFPVRRQPR